MKYNPRNVKGRRFSHCATRVILTTPTGEKVYEGRVPAPNAVQAIVSMDANADLYRDKFNMEVYPITGANYARMTLVDRVGGMKIREFIDD